MKKQIITIALTTLITTILILGVLYGFRLIPEGGTFDFGTLGVYLSATGSISAIFVILHQVKKQGESVQKQIKAQKEGTQRQIKNQTEIIEAQIKNDNIENHKPYLSLASIEESTYTSTHYILLLNDADAIKAKAFDLTFSNIGYGIAHNIQVKKEHPKNYHLEYYSDVEPKPISIDKTLDVPADGNINLHLNIRYAVDSSNGTRVSEDIILKIHYFDLYDTEYSTYLSINIDKNEWFTFKYYSNPNITIVDILKKQVNDISKHYETQEILEKKPFRRYEKNI